MNNNFTHHSTWYHFNKDSGAVGACANTPLTCEIPEENHYSSANRARRAYSDYKDRSPLGRSSLKALTSGELMSTFLREAREVGFDEPLMQRAGSFAKELHRGQFRFAPKWEKRPPYIVHPLRNAIRMIRWGVKDQDVILAGVLHDTIEDSSEKYCADRGISYRDEAHARTILEERLRRDYGKRLAQITLALSNPLQSPEFWGSLSDDEKHAVYVEHVREAIHDDQAVLLAKISDVYDNGAGLYHTAFPERARQTRKQALKYTLLLPIFREEFSRNPIGDPVVRNSVDKALWMIQDRLEEIFSKHAE